MRGFHLTTLTEPFLFTGGPAALGAYVFGVRDDFLELVEILMKVVFRPIAKFFAEDFGRSHRRFTKSVAIGAGSGLHSTPDVSWGAVPMASEIRSILRNADRLHILERNPPPMSDSNQQLTVPRSPEIMRPYDTALLVVDMQARLLPSIERGTRVVWNARRLIDGATILEMQVYATEQYPEKLGPTVDELRERINTEIPEKLSFSCGSCETIFAQLKSQGVHRVLVCGIETHVCVQQTVLDMLASGFQVNVVVDAVGSRFAVDRVVALRRMELSGALVTTTEAALFELCGEAGTDRFRQLSALVKESPPEA